MPIRQKPTTKTEFMRYLDDHEGAVPSLAPRLKEYHAHRVIKKNFGFWVRWKHEPDFTHAYENWWPKNRPE